MNCSEEINLTPSCEVDENLSILREIRFFAGLPLELLRLLAYLCTRVNYKSGDFLFGQGEDDGQAFYIMDGTAQLIQSREKQVRTLRDYGPGQFIGGLSLLGHFSRLFSLQASTNLVCLVLSREKFSKAMKQYPDLTSKIIKSLVESINDWESQFLRTFEEDEAVCRQYAGVSLL